MGDALHLHALPSLDEPTLILAFDGWNDAGDSGTAAANFICDALPMAPLAEIDPEEYYDFTVNRPTLHLDGGQERTIEWPSYRFQFASVAERCDIIVGVGSEPHLRWRSFCDDISELALRMGVRRVVLLGAYLADVLYSRPVRVTGFSHPPEELGSLGIEPSGYEGPTGIVGVLGDRFREQTTPVVSFWAALPHYITATPNPRGALALIQTLTRYLDLPLDQTSLCSAAADFEVQINERVAADPDLAEYVRELKKREFAQ
ncbi:MAG: PAC2 family protein [bacterium]|nr:PAC2 family protein [bacterium]MCP5069347.1 PAC2 family protein [bacterium]